MSQLKQYWDGLEQDRTLESIEVEESLDRVFHRIGRKQRIAKSVLFALVPLLMLTGVVLFYPQNNEIMLQSYAPVGEQRHLELSDGTKVTLNSGSTLVYAEKLGRKQRKVMLNGQAVFEVSKNQHRPFIVSTPKFDIKVLGTVFDVSAYSNSDNASIVLSEGSIALTYDGGETKMVPGQRVEFHNDGSLNLTNVEAGDYMAWKDGGFCLKRAGIDEIMEVLRSNYALNVQCSYSEKYADVCITAKSRNRVTLDSFLQMLKELIPGMSYTLTEDNILKLY